MKEKYNVTGMTCSACSSRVEKTIKNLKGVNDVSVNLLTSSMSVSYDKDLLKSSNIIDAVTKAGYGAFLQNSSNATVGENKNSASKIAEKETKHMKKRLICSVTLLVPLMIVSMGHMLMKDVAMKHALTLVLIQVILLIPIVVLNRKYFLAGFPNLFRRTPNMDSLVALGSSAAIVYGVFALFKIAWGFEMGDMITIHTYSNDIYFESAATILTLITVGKYLETKSKGKTSKAIEKLMNLSPKMAVVERDNAEFTIPADQLRVDDILVVKPGEIIAADGIVVEGSTSVDQSAITGESIPVEKNVGDNVVSATLNKTGFLKIRCIKVGEETTISQIIKLVDEASASKAPIARMADKISGVFVPVVIGIALIATIIWIMSGATFEFALSVGIAVLVISCPCALGLATPVAIMVGTGKGAENGILIKSGQALETAHKINTVVMDKTGTITEGKPQVTDIVTINVEEKYLLSMAAAIEKKSEHPLAEAIVKYAIEKDIEIKNVSDFKADLGKGVIACYDDKISYAGNKLLMAEKGVDLKEYEDIFDSLADEGKTPLIFGQEGKLLGIIAVADVEKATSKAAIETFKKMNIDVVMLTGDNERTAEAIKNRLEIPKVIAQVLPADKERHISKLQEEGRIVAMIGDGINDAPALAKADVGIAIGAGTDVAIESADAVLMRNNLMDAVTALKLSKAVIRNIKENLFWAFIYNVIGIPLAAGILYPMFEMKLSPMFGAAAMSLSSVCVVMNALRLKFFKVERIDDKKEIEQIYTKKLNMEDRKMNKYELEIEGMMCKHCEKHMSEALNAMAGVKAIVSQAEGKAYIDSEREISKEEFKKVVSDAGYKLI